MLRRARSLSRLARLGAVAALAAGAAMAAVADDGHASHQGTGNAHLRLTGSRAPAPGDEARYRALEATIRQGLDRYRNVAVAIADGYEPFRPDAPQRVLHYSKGRHARAAAFGFDPLQPTSLLYRREPGGGLTLTGVMYTAPAWFDEDDLDARVPLAIAPWHQHVNLCVPRRGQKERWSETRHGQPLFGPRSPIATEEACAAVGGRFVERLFGWMVHVEAFASG